MIVRKQDLINYLESTRDEYVDSFELKIAMLEMEQIDEEDDYDEDE